MPSGRGKEHAVPNKGLEIRRFEVEDERASARLEAACVACGDDLVVVIGGGERYHVGAAALAVSVPSPADPGRRTSSGSLMTVPGHKEEDLARAASLRLSRVLGRTAVVTVGIHDDGITPGRIAIYLELHERLVEIIANAYVSPTTDPDRAP
jgi:hypothetical protein